MNKNKIRDTMQKRSGKRTLFICGLIVILCTGIWIWDEFIKYRVFPKRWGVVEAGKIYRSGQLHSFLVKKTLVNHDIQVIVDLTGHDPHNPHQQVEEQAANDLQIVHNRYPLDGDGTGDIKQYVEAIDAIVQARKAGKPVLVHCAAGAQRTGGVIACYRMLIEGRSPDFARKEMAQYGWDEKSNQVLLIYINEHMSELAAQLVEKDIVDEVPDPLPQLSN